MRTRVRWALRKREVRQRASFKMMDWDFTMMVLIWEKDSSLGKGRKGWPGPGLRRGWEEVLGLQSMEPRCSAGHSVKAAAAQTTQPSWRGQRQRWRPGPWKGAVSPEPRVRTADQPGRRAKVLFGLQAWLQTFQGFESTRWWWQGTHRAFSVEAAQFRSILPRGEENFAFGLEFSFLHVQEATTLFYSAIFSSWGCAA